MDANKKSIKPITDQSEKPNASPLPQSKSSTKEVEEELYICFRGYPGKIVTRVKTDKTRRRR